MYNLAINFYSFWKTSFNQIKYLHGNTVHDVPHTDAIFVNKNVN